MRRLGSLFRLSWNRAIINLRDEPLADAQRFRRLHLILGDTNVLPSTLFLGMQPKAARVRCNPEGCQRVAGGRDAVAAPG